MLTLTAAINNGDGTYNLTFSAPVEIIAPFTQEPNVGLYSINEYNWQPTAWLSQIDANTVQAQNAGGSTDCNAIVFFGQPLYLTSTDTFPIVAPEFAIPS